jgi:hypothetical protein
MRGVPYALVCMMIVGCGSSGVPQSPPPGTTHASAKPGEAPKQRGLHAPGNDPAIVALAEGWLTCNWEPGHGYSDECPPGKAWYESKLFDGGKGLPTLVSMLEDERPLVRALAAENLVVHGHEYDDDAALCARVVAAAERERDPSMLERMGDLVASIDLEETHLTDRAIALARSGPLELRLVLIHDLFSSNPFSMPVFELVKGLLADADPKIRAAAVRGFAAFDDLETCDLLVGKLADQEIATDAAWALSYGGNGYCSPSFDALLHWIEARADNGDPRQLIEPLEKLCADREATVAQEKRGAAVLRHWVEQQSLEPGVRAQALRALPACDPRSAEYAAKLQNAPEDEIRREAADVAIHPSEAHGAEADVLAPADPEPPPIEPGAPVKSYAAVAFQKDWDTIPPLDLRDHFPPGAYRIDGTVIGVSAESRGRVHVYLQSGPGKALVLELAASQATAARATRRGRHAQALCDFHGMSSGGFVTMEGCRWESTM